MAAAKLGRLVLSQFVRCKHCIGKHVVSTAVRDLQLSSVYFMCSEQTLTLSLFYFAPSLPEGVGNIAITVFVCVLGISPKPNTQNCTRDFRMLPLAVARSSTNHTEKNHFRFCGYHHIYT